MSSILDQYAQETIPEEAEVVEKKPKKKVVKKNDVPEVEEKREQLCILAVLGTIDQYTGIKMSLGDVKKLASKDVERYYNRYQTVMGNQVAKSLVDTAIETSVAILSYVVPIDNNNELCKDLQNNQLLRQELDNIAGYAVLKGGRFIALSSCLAQLVKHVKINTEVVEDQSLEQILKSSNI